MPPNDGVTSSSFRDNSRRWERRLKNGSYCALKNGIEKLPGVNLLPGNQCYNMTDD